MADVVPLRLRGAPGFSEPAETFLDATDPTRALSITSSPADQAVRLSIETPGTAPTALVLDFDDVLDLVRALVEALPKPAAGPCRPPATVLTWTPRPLTD